MKFVCVISVIVIFSTLTFGNTTSTNDTISCPATSAICVMVTNSTFSTHSLEVGKTKEFLIKNESNKILLYLIERPDSLFENYNGHNKVVINDITYLYMVLV